MMGVGNPSHPLHPMNRPPKRVEVEDTRTFTVAERMEMYDASQLRMQVMGAGLLVFALVSAVLSAWVIRNCE